MKSLLELLLSEIYVAIWRHHAPVSWNNQILLCRGNSREVIVYFHSAIYVLKMIWQLMNHPGHSIAIYDHYNQDKIMVPLYAGLMSFLFCVFFCCRQIWRMYHGLPVKQNSCITTSTLVAALKTTWTSSLWHKSWRNSASNCPTKIRWVGVCNWISGFVLFLNVIEKFTFPSVGH